MHEGIDTMKAVRPSERSRDRRMLANALRMLAVDAVEQAKSGHPGMPMGMADIAEVLWNGYFKHNPADPRWPDRDRFVLSNGHGSMLLYALLHLTGYDLPLEELKRFRQLHSQTPGHPEYGLTRGVETTTGTLGLGKLVAFYDDNGISIDGLVQGWFTDDTPKRFEAYGWRVIRDVDGHDAEAIDAAIRQALAPGNKPTLVCCKTVIGWGAPKLAGTHDAHGAPLGADEAAATRAALGWRFAGFDIPADLRRQWDARAAGATAQERWEHRFAAYAAEYPDLAAEFRRRIAGDLPAGFAERCARWLADAAVATNALATRKASQLAIEALAPLLPELLGGSADLTGSNLTNWKGCRTIAAGQGGNYLHYGVREFGMAAIINGIALHGGYIPFGGTFLV